MAFRLSYCFDGDHKTRPEQNLSGASQKLNRDNLLQRTHEERHKRQQNRLKLQSTEILQSHIRSYLVRKHMKDEVRLQFDEMERNSPIESMLSKLMFFYNTKRDQERFVWICERLLKEQAKVSELATLNSSFTWLLKKYLVLCLKNLTALSAELILNALDVFTRNLDTTEYLIKKGYFRYFYQFLHNGNVGDSLSKTLVLIHRPFQFLHVAHYIQDLFISEFSTTFLKPLVTPTVKLDLIPFLRSKKDFPFDKIIRHLNSAYFYGTSSSLLYCILALEPDHYEPTHESIQVASYLSSNIYQLHSNSRLNDDSDDEDAEMSEDDILLSDCLRLLNRSDRVRKWLQFFDMHSNDLEVLASLTRLCHNLLLVYKDSIRKYLLLYKLGLNGKFLNKLWKSLNDRDALCSQLKCSNFVQWKDCHTKLSVFTDMFTFYTETLTDRENSDTSDTFTQQDLSAMSRLLKDVALDLIEVAFPMSRSSGISPSPEMLHLYDSCLHCLKMLYMLDQRKQFCVSNFWTSRKIHISQDLCRRNYLSKTLQPFHGIVNETEDDERLPPLSTIEQRSLAILQQLPFLINFNSRFLLLRDLCCYSLGDDINRMHHEYSGDNAVIIRRSHLYEDAFNKISTKEDSDLKHRVRIQFINNAGLEEAGIDGGGIFKEFINQVLKTAFDPNRGFFIMTADNALYPNPNVHLIVENYMEHYHFIGRLIGKAIFENILVDVPLAEFFLAKLLVTRASAHYLKSLDPVLYRNLLYLRDYNGDVRDLGLDFTIVNNDLGETRVVELKPNGRDIAVTNENRLEYIQRLADLKLNVQLKKQCIAFREGLNSVVPLLWLKLFNLKEMHLIIGGDTQEIDINDMKANTKYGGDFNEEHPTIVLFWDVIHQFNDSQRKQLLKFVTSCPRPPLLGFKELNPPFCIHSSGSEDRMPTASTCLNLLKLPLIKEETMLKKKLLAAIEQQAGFELS